MREAGRGHLPAPRENEQELDRIKLLMDEPVTEDYLKGLASATCTKTSVPEKPNIILPDLMSGSRSWYTQEAPS